MLVDILCLVIVIFGFYKGFTKGLIIAIFGTLAWILGLIGALKFSSVGAIYMRDKLHIDTHYNPLISFIIIMLVIGLIVFLMGKMLQKIMEVAQLGFVNKLLGALLFTGISLLLFSALLWLANQAGMISPEVKTQSKLYSFVSPIMPFVIDHLGDLIPSIKGTLGDIQHYYNHFSLPEMFK
jgi:membrane protein required for colicin V production